MFINPARRRFAAIAAVLALSMIAVACGGDEPAPEDNGTEAGAPEVTDIKHALPFPAIPSAAPHYVAVEMGFFEDVGLTVENLPGESGAVSVAAVQAGSAQFGNADLSSLALAKSEDPSVDVVQAYFVYTRPANVIYSLKSGANITDPEQLKDTTIYTEPGSINVNIIQGWAEDQGLGEMKFDEVDFESRDRLLVSGKLPAVASIITTKGLLTGIAAEADEELVTLELADFGLDLITSGISVKKEFAEQNPNTVNAYLSALHRGYVYSFQNPEEAGEIMNELFPEISPESVVSSMEILEYSMTADGTVPVEDIGKYDPERLDGTIDFINRVFGFEMTAEDLVITEFAEEIDRDV
jgi:NitT/TauT family transport system substrate-binding protein